MLGYLCSILKVREKALDEKKWSSAITWQLVDNKQTKQKETTHALSSSGTMEAAALFFELMNQICGFAHRKTQRREWRAWYCIYTYGCCDRVSLHGHLLLPFVVSCRSTRDNELSGIHCHLFAAMCSSLLSKG